MTSIPAVVANHPTTSAGGLSGALTTVIISAMMHANIHLTIEEALAWCTLLTCFLGWALRVASKKWPVLDVKPPEGDPRDPVEMQPAAGGTP